MFCSRIFCNWLFSTCQWLVVALLIPFTVVVFHFWTDWSSARCSPTASGPSQCYCSLLNEYSASTCDDDTCIAVNPNPNRPHSIHFELYLSNQYNQPIKSVLPQMQHCKTMPNSIKDDIFPHFSYIATYEEDLYDIMSLPFGSNITYKFDLNEDMIDKIDSLLIFKAMSHQETMGRQSGNTSDILNQNGDTVVVASTRGVTSDDNGNENDNDDENANDKMENKKWYEPHYSTLYLWILPILNEKHYLPPIKTQFIELFKPQNEMDKESNTRDAVLHNTVNILFNNENNDCYKGNSLIVSALRVSKLLSIPENKNMKKEKKVDFYPTMTLAPVGKSPLLADLLESESRMALYQCENFMEMATLFKDSESSQMTMTVFHGSNENSNQQISITVNITMVSLESIATQIILDGIWSTQTYGSHFVDFDCSTYFDFLKNALSDLGNLLKYRQVLGMVASFAEIEFMGIMLLLTEFILVYFINIHEFNVNGILLLPLIIFQFSDFVLSLFIDTSQFYGNNDEYNSNSGLFSSNNYYMNNDDLNEAYGINDIAQAQAPAQPQAGPLDEAEELVAFVTESLLNTNNVGVQIGAAIGIILGIMLAMVVPIYVILRIIKYYNDNSSNNRETKWIKNINSISFLVLIIIVACLRSNNIFNKIFTSDGYTYNQLIFDIMDVYNRSILLFIFIPQIIVNFIQGTYFQMPLKLICLKYFVAFWTNAYLLLLDHRNNIIDKYVVRSRNDLINELTQIIWIDAKEKPGIWLGGVVIVLFLFQKLFL